MGLVGFEVKIISKLCQSFGRRVKALSLGHPDILATPEELSFLGELPIDNKEVHDARRTWPEKRIIGNARPVFNAMNADLIVVDVRPHLYNIDVELDLNDPIIARPEYDLIIDCGTTEHCFNVGQALKNVANMTALGGYVYHMVPLCSFNHGFWNFSPGVFVDFYEDNGFAIERLTGVRHAEFIPVQRHTKFKLPNNGSKLNLLCIAKRLEIKDINYPMQRKYR